MEKGIWKARWQYRSRESREVTAQEEEDKMRKTRLYSWQEKELDYSKLPVTQVPGNPRVIAPAPLKGQGHAT